MLYRQNKAERQASETLACHVQELCAQEPSKHNILNHRARPPKQTKPIKRSDSPPPAAICRDPTLGCVLCDDKAEEATDAKLTKGRYGWQEQRVC